MKTGEQLRDNVMLLLNAKREYHIRRIQREFLNQLLKVGDSTTDNVSNSTPPEIRKNCMGAAVNWLAKAGLISFVEFTVSSRPERHACAVRVWRLIDQAKAIQWLAYHPDVIEPMAVAEQGTLFETGALYE